METIGVNNLQWPNSTIKWLHVSSRDAIGSKNIKGSVESNVETGSIARYNDIITVEERWTPILLW